MNHIKIKNSNVWHGIQMWHNYCAVRELI